MSDLKCTECGREASYADASIADSYRTCGGNDRAVEVEDDRGYVRFDYGPGGRHDWIEL